jgi:paired amphipathic helix protein Sin3a
MKTAAQDLSSTRSGDALKNTAYTKFGKANPRFSGQEAPTSEFLYESMLELCEKLFGSEIDQPTFEDGVRALFGNKAFHIFTIDKLLSSLVKTVWSLIDSNRETYAANGEIFKLLVDDRRYPTTAQAQQISYRINAELAAGSDEHLYRIEWLPRRHQLTFQLLGKDEVLPEDESDLSKAWERYIESFVGDTVTKGLPLTEKEIIRNVCLHRNLKTVKEDDAAKGKRVLAKSELETRICMRSYRMFWQGDTEDAMHRVWPSEPEKDTLDELENKRKERFGKWLEKRNAALEQQAAEKEKEKHNKEGASPAVASASAKPSGSVPPPSSSEATPKPEEKAENKEDREAKEKEKEESTDVTMQAATNAISSSA